MIILIRGLIITAIKGITALALGSVVLWHVVDHCGPTKGIAYIHASTSDVDIMVDNETYHVDTLWDSPIVCELSGSRHTLRMRRGGRTVFEQDFRLKPGEETVLVAWEQPDRSRDEQNPSSPSFKPTVAGSRLAQKTP